MMHKCHFCGEQAEANVQRRHPGHAWEVRLRVCEDCLLYRLDPLSEEEAIEECVTAIEETIPPELALVPLYLIPTFLPPAAPLRAMMLRG